MKLLAKTVNLKINKSLNSYVDHIFVNHISHRNDRMHSFEYQFRILNSSYEIFNAITNTNGGKGNKQSFIKILELSYGRGYRNIFFCEDDVIFRKSILEYMESIITDIKNEIDILFFHHHQPPIQWISTSNIQICKKPWCTHFMLINNIVKVYNELLPYFNSCDGLDYTLYKLNACDKIKIAITKKEMAFQLDDISSISNTVVERFSHKNNYNDLILKEK